MKQILLCLSLFLIVRPLTFGASPEVERKATSATVQLLFRKLDFTKADDFNTYTRLLEESQSPDTFGEEIQSTATTSSLVSKTGAWIRVAVSLFPMEENSARKEAFDVSTYVSGSPEPNVQIRLLTPDARTMIEAEPTNLNIQQYYAKVSWKNVQGLSPSFLNGLLDGFAACGPANLQSSEPGEAACRVALAVALDQELDTDATNHPDVAALQNAARAFYSTPAGALLPQTLQAGNITGWPTWLPTGRNKDGQLLGNLLRVNVNQVAPTAPPVAADWQPRDTLKDVYSILAAAADVRQSTGPEINSNGGQAPLSSYLNAVLVPADTDAPEKRENFDRTRRLLLEEHLRRLKAAVPERISPDHLAGLIQAEASLLQKRQPIAVKSLGADGDSTSAGFWIPAVLEVPRFLEPTNPERAADLAFTEWMLNSLAETFQKQNTRDYRIYMALGLTKLCQTCRAPDQLENATGDVGIKALSKLWDFWAAARGNQEEFFALRFLQWTPHFWREEMWRDGTDAWISTGTQNKFNQAKAYHRQQTKLLTHFSQKLATPWAKASSFAGLAHPASNDSNVVSQAYLKHPAYQISTMLSAASATADMGLYRHLFGSIYEKVPILVYEPPAAAPSTPAGIPEINNIKAKSLLNFVGADQFGELSDDELVDAFRWLSNSNKLPSDLAQVAKAFCAAINPQYASLSTSPAPVVLPQGEGIYEQPVFEILALAYLRRLEDTARLDHIKVGFIHLVDSETGMNMPNPDQAQKLKGVMETADCLKGLLNKLRETGPMAAWEAALDLGKNNYQRSVAGAPTSPFGIEDFFSLSSPLWSGVQIKNLNLPPALQADLQASGSIRFAPRADSSVVPLIAFTRNNPLQLIPPDPSLAGGEKASGLPPMASLVDQALARLWIVNRERMTAAGASRDAFGIVGPLQASNGTQDLISTMSMLATWLQQNDLGALSRWVKTTTDRQEASIAADAADDDVVAEAALLGAAQKDLEIANRFINYNRLGADSLRSDAVAHHFLQESARLHAEAAQARAAIGLLKWNRDSYEIFQVKAQYEMILEALPRYYLELRKSELELGQITDLVNDLAQEIARERQNYLDEDHKDVGDIVRAITVKVVDCVCAFYGLPPLGTLINTTFEGIQAAAKGDWEAAFQNFADVAQKTGFDTLMKDKLDDWGKDLGVDQLLDGLQNNHQFQNFATFAKQAGLSDAAESYGLCLVNRAAKSVLPPKAGPAVDILFPDANLHGFSGKHLSDRLLATVSTEGQRLGEAYLRSSGQQILESLSDDKKYQDFINDKLLNGSHTIDAADTQAMLKSARDHALADVKATLDDAVQQRGESFKARLLAHAAAMAAGDNATTEQSNAIAEMVKGVEKEVRETPNFSLQTWWTANPPSPARQKLEDLAKKMGTNDEWKDMEAELKKGNVGQAFSGSNLKNLGKSLIATASTEVGSHVDQNSPDTEKIKGELTDTETWLRNTLAQVETTVQMYVVHETSKQFYPKATGALVKALSDWEDELNDRLAAFLNTPTADKLKEDYAKLTTPYRQVDLRDFFTDAQIEQLMKPPQVHMATEVAGKFKTFDAALTQAEQVVRQSFDAGLASKLHDFVNQISRYQDTGAFEKARDQLLAILTKPRDEALAQIRKAIDAAGGPPSSVNTSVLDVPLKDLAATETKRFSSRSKMLNLSDEAAENQLEPDLRIDQIQKKRKALQLAFIQMLGGNADGNLPDVEKRGNGLEKGRKLASMVDLEKPENETFKRFTDYQMLFVLGLEKAPDGSVLPLPANYDPSTLQERISATIDRFQGVLHPKGGGQSWTELFGTAADFYDKQYDLFLQQLQSQAEQYGEQNDAAGYAHAAAAEAAFKRGSDLRVQQAAISVDMATIARDKATDLVKAQRARLDAAQARYQIAATKRDAAAFQQWEQRVSGADFTFAPTDYAQVQAFLWRCIRDYDFFLRILEANPTAADNFFINVIQAQDKNTGLLGPVAMNQILNHEEITTLIRRNNPLAGGWWKGYVPITLTQTNFAKYKPYLRPVTFTSTLFGGHDNKFYALPVAIAPSGYLATKATIPSSLAQSLFNERGDFRVAGGPPPLVCAQSAYIVESEVNLTQALSQVVTHVAYDDLHTSLHASTERPALAFLGNGRFYTKSQGALRCLDFPISSRLLGPDLLSKDPFSNPDDGGLGYHWVTQLATTSDRDPGNRLSQTFGPSGGIDLPTSRRFRFFPLMGTWEVLISQKLYDVLSRPKQGNDEIGITLYFFYAEFSQ